MRCMNWVFPLEGLSRNVPELLERYLKKCVCLVAVFLMIVISVASGAG